jgi:hypothetical protein
MQLLVQQVVHVCFENLHNPFCASLQMIQPLLARHSVSPSASNHPALGQQQGPPPSQQGQQCLQQQTQHELDQAAADLQHQHQQQDFLSEKLTMLFLLQVPSAWGPADGWAHHQQHKVWHQLMDSSAVSIVEGEVQYLRQQLLHIEDVLQEGKEAAAGAGGVTSVGVCNSCPFQLDCQVKGCIRGDLDDGSPSKCHHHIHQHAQLLDRQQQQGQQDLRGAAAAAMGVPHVAAAQVGWQDNRSKNELSGNSHACCS